MRCQQRVQIKLLKNSFHGHSEENRANSIDHTREQNALEVGELLWSQAISIGLGGIFARLIW